MPPQPTSLTDYRTLGRSGLVVSPLALGTMTFGTPRWGTDESTSRDLLHQYVDAGGNFVDTANIYSRGESERFLGRFLAEGNLRDRVVLSTKFGFNDQAGNPHGGGNGAKHLRRSIDASLTRLRTDHIDLYWAHIWDGVTPAEELLESLCGLVRSGKILYYGLSDVPAWFAVRLATLAAERGLPGPIALQVEYSLVARDIEREHVPAAQELGMSVVAWSPLAGGFLSGKYERATVESESQVGFALPDGGEAAGETESSSRLKGANPFGDTKFTEKNWRVLDMLRAVAGEVEASPAEVSLAWLTQRRGVGSVLIGARNSEQLDANLKAASLQLSESQRQRLDEVGANTPGFSDSLTSLGIRRMLFGGHDVRGW